MANTVQANDSLLNTGSPRPSASLSRQLIATVVSSLATLSLGLSLGFSSPAIPALQAANVLDEELGSWFGSLVTVGALTGGPVAGWLVELLGRKPTIMLTSVPYMAGWLICAYSNFYGVLFIGRILSGFSCGAASLAVNVYIAEISTKEYRGRLGSISQIGAVTGVLIVNAAAIFLDIKWLALFCASWAVLLVLLMCFLPETPRYLLATNRRHEALHSIWWLRGPEYDAEEECALIETNLDQQENMTWDEFRKPGLYRPLILILVTLSLQQFCGINAIMFYADTIFSTAGFSGNAKIPTLIITAVLFVVTVIAALLIDKAGRKVLLSVSGILMTLSCIGLGLYYYLTLVTKIDMNISWLSLGSLVAYVIAFSIGWGAVPWIMMGEFFPIRARGIASGLATFTSWMCGFIITKEFLPLGNLIHMYGLFWLLGGICFVSVLFVIRFIPETKGHSLEEIEILFEGH